jgi:hypothetical protein
VPLLESSHETDDPNIEDSHEHRSITSSHIKRWKPKRLALTGGMAAALLATGGHTMQPLTGLRGPPQNASFPLPRPIRTQVRQTHAKTTLLFKLDLIL